jgi:hypothetical protein
MADRWALLKRVAILAGVMPIASSACAHEWGPMWQEMRAGEAA